MSLAIAELFKRVSTGVYVIGVADGGQRNAFTAAWVMPVSFRPLLLAVSVNPRHSSYALLKAGGGFSVNVLGQGQAGLAALFGGSKDSGKLAQAAWQPGRQGAPLLDEALACFECEWAGESLAGDHVLVLGRVVDGAVSRPDVAPLAYADPEVWGMARAAELFPDDFS